jgi:molecular chaperone GrpE
MGFSRQDQQPGGPDSEDAFARDASASASADENVADGRVAPSTTEPLEAALLESKDKYLRLAAEYDNYRKRVTRERQEERARAQADLVKHLVDGLDDLARVAHVDPQTIDAAAAVHGADIAERKLLKALQNAGLELVNPTDQAFDPALHEAVGTEPALSPEDDHVIARVYQPGYVFNGQLIRPARVVVKQWNG